MATEPTTPTGIVPDPGCGAALIAALRTTSDAVLTTDASGVIQWVNPAFTTLTGYAAEEVVGQSPRVLRSGLHPTALFEDLWRTVLAGRCWRGTLRNRRKDGTLYWEDQTITPVADASGKVHTLVAVKRAAADRAAEPEPERADPFQLLFDSAPIPYHQLDRDGRITRVNQAECQLLGLLPEQVIGRPAWELVAPEEREGSRAAVESKLRGEYPLAPIVRSYSRADGSRVIVEIHEKLIRDEQGEISGILSALIDMTARMKFELALAESNARYEGLFDNSSDGIFIIRAEENGRLLAEAMNAAYQGQYELTGSDVEGRPIESLLRPACGANLLERCAECIRRGEPVMYEDAFPGSEGERIYVTQLFPVRDASGRIARLAGISRDVTDRRRMEQKLREREEQLRLVLEGNRDGVWDWSIPDGKMDLSPRCFAMLGYQPGEVAATEDAWAGLMHPDDRPVVMLRMRESYLNAAGSFEAEHRMRTKDGAWRWVQCRGKVIVADSDGLPLRALGTYTDIDTRKTAELALRDSEDRFRSVVNALAEGVIVRDQRGVVTACNAAACRITGRAESELIGSDTSEWPVLREDGSPLPPGDHASLIALRTGQAVLGLVMGLPGKSGETVWLSVNAEPLIHAGEARPYSVVASLTDITELRKTIRQLEDARRAAESATRAKSDFLAMMSHEIRTPMNGVLGMCELLMASGLLPDQRTFASAIAESGQALLSVINDILDISKIEAGRLELEKAPFSLRKTLEGVVNLLMPNAQRKGLSLQFAYPSSAPSWFLGDAVRVRQIVTNLLGNAIKFTDAGTVSLEVSWDGRLQLEIADTGIGISEQDLPRLFSKFSQAGPVSRSRSGTGLGLAICKQLTDRMGGSIEIRSREGAGSTFTVQIPLEMSDPSLAKPVTAYPAQTVQGASVLLVDDNTVNQRVGVAMLMKLGCVVATAADGEEAVSLAARRRFDAILMDCKMPRMDGYEATRAIRSTGEPSGRTPIIALTASAMEEDRRRCEAAGMDDYLTKPIQLELLCQALSRWVQPTVLARRS
ncbi:MAG: PAS domain S-box protein [Acidobacteria bacterium]|nr:PAS domain S-box protein [Acidobacteriota bacterium]